MNKFSTNLLIAGLIAGALATAGCSGGDSPFYSQQQLGAEKYVMSGTLLDATTNTALSGTVTLTATDKNGAAVKLYRDATGGTEVTTLTIAADGNITFFVDKNAALPITLKIVAKASNSKYLQSSTTVIINNTGNFDVSIKLVDTTAAGAGVTSTTTAGTASGTGALTALLANTAGNATITFPAGTVLKTADGTPLTGALSLQVTDFAVPTGNAVISDATAGTTTTLDMFPGGLGNIVLTGADPSANQGAFASAGYAAVTLVDAAGNKAAKVDPGQTFKIRLDIPAGTVNPETGVAIAVGDEIPLWTYNETTGDWKADTDLSTNKNTVTVKAAGAALYTEYTTNHLSYWNLDWFYSKTCTGTLTFKNDAAKLPLRLKATFSNKGGYLYSGYKYAGESSITVFRVPQGKPLNIFAISGTQTVASLKNVDLCANPVIDYTAPVAQAPVPVKVTVKNVCKYDINKTVAIPTTPVIYKGTNSGNAGSTDTTGTLTVNVPAGNYTFGAYDRLTGSYYTDSTTAHAISATSPHNDVTIMIPTASTSVCGSTTGTTGTTGSGTGILF